LISIVPGPGVTSCAAARTCADDDNAAMTTAIEHFMTTSCNPFNVSAEQMGNTDATFARKKLAQDETRTLRERLPGLAQCAYW